MAHLRSISLEAIELAATSRNIQPSWTRWNMIFERTMVYSLYTPYSISFRMVVDVGPNDGVFPSFLGFGFSRIVIFQLFGLYCCRRK